MAENDQELPMRRRDRAERLNPQKALPTGSLDSSLSPQASSVSGKSSAGVSVRHADTRRLDLIPENERHSSCDNDRRDHNGH